MSRKRSNSKSSSSPRSWNLASLVMAMLGSSCCTIQLVLNAFNVGCAGFAILDPFRLPFTLVTLISLGYSIRKYGWSQTRMTTFISLLLLASPTIVTLTSQNVPQDAISSAKIAISSALLPVWSTMPKNSWFWTGFTPKSQKKDMEFHLKVTGMKCEACGLKVKQTLEQVVEKSSVKVFQKQGRVVVRVKGASNWDTMATKLSEGVESLGYQVQVVSPDPFDALQS